MVRERVDAISARDDDGYWLAHGLIRPKKIAKMIPIT
jgi:hypothetical protein